MSNLLVQQQFKKDAFQEFTKKYFRFIVKQKLVWSEFSPIKNVWIGLIAKCRLSVFFSELIDQSILRTLTDIYIFSLSFVSTFSGVFPGVTGRFS
jgi:hypothetical protein